MPQRISQSVFYNRSLDGTRFWLEPYKDGVRYLWVAGEMQNMGTASFKRAVASIVHGIPMDQVGVVRFVKRP
jgi:hypothetical protein